MPRLILFVLVLLTCCTVSLPAQPVPQAPKLVAPFKLQLKYPFTKHESMQCGRWGSGSQDYPYFGAPRNGGRRRHAGVDLYPSGGAGTVVVAVQHGVVRRVAPFYKRSNGEMTYAILVDHGDISVNYAELKRPTLHSGMAVRQGQPLGRISGTRQLHLELYRGGTESWTRGWYGQQPDNLLDPTSLMLELFPKPSR